jgi:hypothetical protein
MTEGSANTSCTCSSWSLMSATAQVARVLLAACSGSAEISLRRSTEGPIAAVKLAGTLIWSENLTLASPRRLMSLTRAVRGLGS